MEYIYALEIEKKLCITKQIDMCNALFLEFVENKKVDISTEINFLTEIKRFMMLEEKNIRKINKCSQIKNYDCLTMAIIACLISNRNSFSIKIGKPNILSRYYHSVLITSDHQMFKLTGKRRDYGFDELSVDNIIKRLLILKPVVSFFDKILLKTY